MSSTESFEEYQIEGRNGPDGEWLPHQSVTINQDRVRHVENLREHFNDTDWEFRLVKRTVTQTATEWMEVT